MSTTNQQVPSKKTFSSVIRRFFTRIFKKKRSALSLPTTSTTPIVNDETSPPLSLSGISHPTERVVVATPADSSTVPPTAILNVGNSESTSLDFLRIPQPTEASDRAHVAITTSSSSAPTEGVVVVTPADPSSVTPTAISNAGTSTVTSLDISGIPQPTEASDGCHVAIPVNSSSITPTANVDVETFTSLGPSRIPQPTEGVVVATPADSSRSFVTPSAIVNVGSSTSLGLSRIPQPTEAGDRARGAVPANPPSATVFSNTGQAHVTGGEFISFTAESVIVNVTSGNSGARASGLRMPATESAGTAGNNEVSPVLDTTSLNISIRRKSQVYHDCLFKEGRGSALWTPGPDRNLPVEYRREGTRIGDVGIIKGDGDFSFLFNILLPACHPINRDHVPEAFVQLDHGEMVVKEHDVAEEYVASENVNHLKSVGESLHSGLIFESVAIEGAVLTTPGGALLNLLENLSLFRIYIQEHIERWYEYANKALGYEARNGDIRLVYGTEKVASWGMAAFSNTSERKVYLEFRKAETIESSSNSYTWNCRGPGASYRSGSSQRDSRDLLIGVNDPQLINQSVFIRTLNPTLSDQIWEEKFAHTIPACHEYDPPIRNPLRSSTNHGGGSSSRVTPLSGRTGGRESYRAGEKVAANDAISHPSAILNHLIFSLAPNAQIVISDDRDWLSIFHKLPSMLQHYANTSFPSDDDTLVHSELSDYLGSVLKMLSPVTAILDQPIRASEQMGLHNTEEVITASEAALEYEEAQSSGPEGPLVDPIDAGSDTETKTQEDDGVTKNRSSKHKLDEEDRQPPPGPQSSEPAPLSQVRLFDPNRTFAVIVGINEYADPEIKPLHGAVADADSVEEFLIINLSIPPNNIKTLRNEEATRNSIKDAILHLTSDDRIQKDDSIIIYYAGHGSEAKTPEQWLSPDMKNDISLVQMLLPHDFKAHHDRLSPSLGQGITERTLSGLLRLVADAKGNNIVVILDSCHSSSGARGLNSEPEEMDYRNVELSPNYTIDPSIDDDLTNKGPGEAHAYEGMESHVLLAACRQEERAWEHRNRGNFTTKLVERLVELHQVEGLGKTSYEELISELPPLENWKLQHPRCEGTTSNLRRALFSTSIVPSQQKVFPVSFIRGDSPYVGAGISSSITSGVKSKITDKDQGEIRTASAEVPGGFRSPRVIETNIGPSEVSLTVTNQGRSNYFIDVFVNPALLKELEAYPIEGSLSEILPNIHFACSIEDARIAVVVEDGSIHLRFFNVFSCQGVELEKTISSSDGTSIPRIISILESVSHFFLHLEHSGMNRFTNALSHQIRVKCYQVTRTGAYHENEDEAYKRFSPNLQRHRAIAVVGYFEEVHRLPYALCIVNYSDIAFYAYVYIFSACDLTIYCAYEPKREAKSHCLAAGSALYVGYDDTPVPPFAFSIPSGWKKDLCFLKLFLSTKKLDLSGMERAESPFEEFYETSRRDSTPPPVTQIYGGFWIPIVVTAG